MPSSVFLQDKGTQYEYDSDDDQQLLQGGFDFGGCDVAEVVSACLLEIFGCDEGENDEYVVLFYVLFYMYEWYEFSYECSWKLTWLWWWIVNIWSNFLLCYWYLDSAIFVSMC